MTTTRTFDVVVIGGGPGGETAAATLADAGASVAVVERELVGGECPYWGCMPSKALLRPAQALDEVRRVPGAAEAITGELDVTAVLTRRDEVVRELDDASHAGRLTKRGIELVRGHGRLCGERSVEVEIAGSAPVRLEATKAVILAPGSRAALPPIDGLASARPWTNREATLATEIPEHLAVLGGGPIGVELAQAFASLGSKVRLVEAADRVLGREEPEAAALVTAALGRVGVEVRTGTRAERVHRTESGQAVVTFADGSSIHADEVLVAAGRQATTGDLGLETVGVEPGRHGIVEVCDCMHVDEHPWLFVVGDANGRALLTHAAAYQARVAARNALGLRTHCVEDALAAPRVLFSDPQLAAVGHTLHSALDAGIDARAFDRDPQHTAAGSFVGRGTTGFARLVVDMSTGCIVGATFVGAEIAELLQSATVAIVGAVPIERLRHCVAPFPTRSEVWRALVDLLDADETLRARG